MNRSLFLLLLFSGTGQSQEMKFILEAERMLPIEIPLSIVMYVIGIYIFDCIILSQSCKILVVVIIMDPNRFHTLLASYIKQFMIFLCIYYLCVDKISVFFALDFLNACHWS